MLLHADKAERPPRVEREVLPPDARVAHAWEGSGKGRGRLLEACREGGNRAPLVFQSQVT